MISFIILFRTLFAGTDMLEVNGIASVLLNKSGVHRHISFTDMLACCNALHSGFCGQDMTHKMLV